MKGRIDRYLLVVLAMEFVGTSRYSTVTCDVIATSFLMPFCNQNTYVYTQVSKYSCVRA
jgi:hypothetical protein